MSPGSGSRAGLVAVRVVLAATVCHGQPVATEVPPDRPSAGRPYLQRVARPEDEWHWTRDREWEWKGDTGSSGSRADCRLPLARLPCNWTPPAQNDDTRLRPASA
jgi:hypothetical protein